MQLAAWQCAAKATGDAMPPAWQGETHGTASRGWQMCWCCAEDLPATSSAEAFESCFNLLEVQQPLRAT